MSTPNDAPDFAALIVALNANTAALARLAAPTPPAAPPPSNGPVFLTVEQAGELLGLTPRAIYARASRGQLPGAVKVGRSLRFRRDALLKAFVEGRASSPKGRR